VGQGLGEFILTHPNIQIPSRGKIYSINEGNSLFYHEPVLKWLDSVKSSSLLQRSSAQLTPERADPANGKPYSARYIGSMVADVHRTLLYGGIFGYPDDKKSKNGKLRLLYEGNVMAYLVEQAGGLATTGRERILDIVPEQIHQRVPVFMGSKEDVEDVVCSFVVVHCARLTRAAVEVLQAVAHFISQVVLAVQRCKAQGVRFLMSSSVHLAPSFMRAGLKSGGRDRSKPWCSDLSSAVCSFLAICWARPSCAGAELVEECFQADASRPSFALTSGAVSESYARCETETLQASGSFGSGAPSTLSDVARGEGVDAVTLDSEGSCL
jgi:hypothetical protein